MWGSVGDTCPSWVLQSNSGGDHTEDRNCRVGVSRQAGLLGGSRNPTATAHSGWDTCAESGCLLQVRPKCAECWCFPGRDTGCAESGCFPGRDDKCAEDG